MFGFARSSHVDFLEKSNVAYRHLFLEGWDPSFETLPYPPATGTYAIYTKPAFYKKIDWALERVEYFLCLQNAATIDFLKSS